MVVSASLVAETDINLAHAKMCVKKLFVAHLVLISYKPYLKDFMEQNISVWFRVITICNFYMKHLT